MQKKRQEVKPHSSLTQATDSEAKVFLTFAFTVAPLILIQSPLLNPMPSGLCSPVPASRPATPSWCAPASLSAG